MKQDLIPGIYNYCNRWCERCSFNYRCRVYSKQLSYEESFNDLDNPLTEEAKSIEIIKKSLDEALALLDEKAKELDVDFNNLPQQEIHELNPKALNNNGSFMLYLNEFETINETPFGENLAQFNSVYDTPVLKLSAIVQESYIMFMQQQELFNNAINFIENSLSMGIISEDTAVQTINKINHNRYILCSFPLVLSGKLVTAYQDKLSADKANKRLTTNSHANGTAKVSLLLINDIISAIEALQHNTEIGDQLDLLAALSGIKRHLHKDFPNAELFIRPGFDE